MTTICDFTALRHLLHEETLPALCHFVELPAKSRFCDPDWERHGVLRQALEEAAAWGRARFPSGHFEVTSLEGKTPALFFDIPAVRHEGRPAFFYGHFDKQPEAEGWSEGLAPFKPVLRSGKLYGRGCADDGYSFYTALTAALHLHRRGMPCPRITGLIETDEESGSRDLPDYLRLYSDRIGSPAFLGILDLGVRSWDRLWTTESLRGIAQVTVRVSVLRHGVHSGSASGTVPSSFRILRALLDRIEDAETGRILLPECHAPIPDGVRARLTVVAEWPAFPWAGDTRPMHATPGECLLASTWMPALSVVAQDGLPSLENGSAQLRTHTTLSLSMRLPPAVDAGRALQAMKDALTHDVPYGAEVTITQSSVCPGFYAPQDASWLAQAWQSAGTTLFDHEPDVANEGGTIGILQDFRKNFPESPFLMTGMLGPQSNAHGPDESLDIAYWEKLTAALVHVLAAVPGKEAT